MTGGAGQPVSPWSLERHPRDRLGECDPFRRVGARVVDFIPHFAVVVATLAAAGRVDLSDSERLPIIIFPVIYELVMVGLRGQTLGKMAVHARVVAADGGRASWAQAAVRSLSLYGLAGLAGYVSVLGAPSMGWLFLTLAMMFFHGLGPHDYLARTKVVLDTGINRS